VQIIRKNFGLKALALGLAIVGWAYFRYAGNPIVAEARFDQQISVPITVEHVPPGYVAGFDRHSVLVTVERKRGEPPVREGEIRAVLDLAEKGPGHYNVPVELIAPDVAVQSLSPASVAVTVSKATAAR
jgi:hypothetical protein